jgi:hypothetical protein
MRNKGVPINVKVLDLENKSNLACKFRKTHRERHFEKTSSLLELELHIAVLL